LASVLFHYHEWLFEYHRPQLETHFGKTIATAGALWGNVESGDNRFGFIRDVANSSKHVRLTRHPSTSMTHIANTSIYIGAFDSATYRAAFDVSKVKMKNGAIDVDFDDCARALFSYWTNLSKKIGAIT
jgi:hypothetical protein